jgi:DNA-binding NarL/FixJ family response regulator
MREGLCKLIEAEPDMVIWGQVGNAPDALFLLEKGVPDVALVDIVLPGSSSGIELTTSILASYPDVKVLILSMHDDSTYVQRAYTVGASGYVTKSEVAGVILQAIRTVWGGRKYFTRAHLRQEVPESSETEKKPKSRYGGGKLTRRELLALELIGRGLTRKQIAERMSIELKTVEAHREHMRTKLGLRSAHELLRYAIRKFDDSAQGSAP